MNKNSNFKQIFLYFLMTFLVIVLGLRLYLDKQDSVLLIFDLSIYLIFFLFSTIIFSKNKIELEKKDEKLKEIESTINSQNLFLDSYIQALDNTSAVIKTDPFGKIIYVNDKFLSDTGFSRQEVIGNDPKIIRHPDTNEKIIKDMWDTISQKKIWSGVIKGFKKDKTLFISKIYIVPVLDENNNVIEYIAPRTDITELVTSRDKLQHMLVTDRLTHFPNRQKLINDIKTNKAKIHLALINIDRFKEINDFYGHEVADGLLIEVANLLKKEYKDKAKIYKLPSDEYAILNERDISPEQFYLEIKSLLKKISQTKMLINSNTIFISFSCGMASDNDSLMVKADMALQIAKEDKKHIIVYDDSLDISKKIIKNIQGVALLKEAIEHDTIVPHFQPIYNIHTKEIEKYEVLARITENNGYVIAPIKFLDIAMKSKLYPHITKTIINKSFEFFKDKSYEFSINISYEDIRNSETKEFILEKLEKCNFASKVTFEIVESDKISDFELLKNFIKDVKKFACKIAIDDFGSGYSNFVNLYELNIDYLKIDASLVKDVRTDDNSRKIVHTIINFAKDFNLQTIAEYVEDKESLELLEFMGIDYIQGYYIGKPRDCIKSK